MSDLTLLVISFLVLVFIGTSGWKVMKAQRSKKNIPWMSIYTLAINTLQDVMATVEMDKADYAQYEDYVIGVIKIRIDRATFIDDEVKLLLTKKRLKAWIGPELKKRYEKRKYKEVK